MKCNQEQLINFFFIYKKIIFVNKRDKIDCPTALRQMYQNK